MMAKRKDMSLLEIRQYNQRKKGIIKRRTRNPNNLTEAQKDLAEQIQDRYLLEWEQAATYLDWYVALSNHWIDAPTFRQETGTEPYPF